MWAVDGHALSYRRVYGCPSDPQKVARLRVINRAWRAEAGRHGGSFLGGEIPLEVADPVLLNATRFALKLGEHTWGRDVKSNLVDNTNWKNPDFWAAKKPPAKTAPQYVPVFFDSCSVAWHDDHLVHGWRCNT